MSTLKPEYKPGTTSFGRSADFRDLLLSGEGYRMEAFTNKISSMFPADGSSSKWVGILLKTIVNVVVILASYGIAKLLGIDTMKGLLIYYSIIAVIALLMVYGVLALVEELNANTDMKSMLVLAYNAFMSTASVTILVLGAYALSLVAIGKSSKVSSRNFFGGSRFPYQ
jgi:hypothetical protein